MPLLWLSLAFLAGVACAGSLLTVARPVSLVDWLLLAGISAALLLIRPFTRSFRSRFPIPSLSNLPPLPALILAFALGGARLMASLPDLNDPGYIAYHNNPKVVYRVTGVLRSPPEVSDRSARLKLSTESLLAEGQKVARPVEGALLVTDWDLGDWSYGDRLIVTGTLEIPPEGEGFSYRAYLEHQGIYSAMQPDRMKLLGSGYGNPMLVALYRLRDRLLELTYRLYPDPEASLLAGILLGVESGIPSDVKSAFQDSGTAHIIAISGFNIPLTQTEMPLIHL
jgi:competence protein ComEC